MEPLAARIRPTTLDEVVGQVHHLVGPESVEGSTKKSAGPLRVAVEKKHRFSFILWGPPRTGKTTIARIYAHALDAELFELSAVSAGKDDIRKIVGPTSPAKRATKGAQQSELLGEKPKVLFLDEIHRFNKSQQDFLLPYVESGELTLIGATTENPSFEIIAPLLSRCRVFVLEPLSEEALRAIVKSTKLKVNKDAFDWLLGYSNGDARKALGMMEGAQSLYGEVTAETLNKALESPHLRYDKKGEEHYDTISAFIKSMRASQADAALYYLARMVEAREDPLFIAYPECAINLAHGVAYLAQAKKDRSAYDALRSAQTDVHAHGNLPIPKKVRNVVTKLMKELDYGKGYEKYSDESYLPDKLNKKKYLPAEGGSASGGK